MQNDKWSDTRNNASTIEDLESADSRAFGPAAVTCWQTVSHWACLRKHGSSGLRPHHRLTGDRERYPHMVLPQLGWRTVRHSILVRAKVERDTQRALPLFVTQCRRSGFIWNLKVAKWSETWRWKRGLFQFLFFLSPSVNWKLILQCTHLILNLCDFCRSARIGTCMNTLYLCQSALKAS